MFQVYSENGRKQKTRQDNFFCFVVAAVVRHDDNNVDSNNSKNSKSQRSRPRSQVCVCVSTTIPQQHKS